MNEILKETNFDENFPQDDSYISDFPAGARKQNKALKDEQIVDAGKLQGLIPSNENGQIPINNGNENINLNAGMLNGKTSSDFAPKSHSHDVATQDSNGYMSNADKRKLDGIASGAEVNQNAFANVKVGSNTIQADAKQDTLELAAGTNISLVGDANNDKVTIAVTGKVASASQADSATNATNATSATKATQDSTGQTINTTYVKGVTANNATLTITKGNGSTSTTTINNVSNATNANNLVISGTSAHIKYGGGDVDENTAISQNKVNLLIGSWYSTGFRDLCSTGNPIRVAINHRNGNIKTTGNVTANGAMYSATPATTDNSTRVATTAYVKNNISETLKKVYPVGSIYMSTVSTNPATLFGFGTWEAMPAGRVLLAQGKSSWGTTYNAGSTGGEATHQLTVGELPSHNHSGSTNAAGEHTHPVKRATTGNSGSKPAITYDTYMPAMSIDTVPITNASGSHTHSITISATGSGQAHNNIQPYIATYMWKRTA